MDLQFACTPYLPRRDLTLLRAFFIFSSKNKSLESQSLIAKDTARCTQEDVFERGKSRSIKIHLRCAQNQKHFFNHIKCPVDITERIPAAAKDTSLRKAILFC